MKREYIIRKGEWGVTTIIVFGIFFPPLVEWHARIRVDKYQRIQFWLKSTRVYFV